MHYEDWHYRYVGPEIARFITDKGWTLEEFTARLGGEGARKVLRKAWRKVLRKIPRKGV